MPKLWCGLRSSPAALMTEGSLRHTGKNIYIHTHMKNIMPSFPKPGQFGLRKNIVIGPNFHSNKIKSCSPTCDGQGTTPQKLKLQAPQQPALAASAGKK